MEMVPSVFAEFRYLFVQNKHSQDLLNKIGIGNVLVTGDTRFDRVARVAQEAKEIPFIEKFCNGEKVIVAGSTWPKDEEILVEYIENNHQKAKLIIVPHEINSNHIQEIQKSLTVETLLYTKHQSISPENARVLIVDTVGLLSSVYRYGHIAYIGGGFGVGIHNTLEAATFGLPIIFGPNYHKFQEAKDLIALKAAFSINALDDLSNFLNSLLDDEQMRISSGNNSKKLVLSGVGATDRILNQIASNAQF
jgi:3-deoxy-D-manno-octulosonic-acid transferase